MGTKEALNEAEVYLKRADNQAHIEGQKGRALIGIGYALIAIANAIQEQTAILEKKTSEAKDQHREEGHELHTPAESGKFSLKPKQKGKG